MSSKGVSTERESKQMESSSEEHIDSSYDSTNIPQIFLDFEEKPELIIEKILINIFNKFITPGNVDMEYSDIQIHQKKIKLLCLQQEKSKIVYILLTKIRSLIKKYREKLFELPNIIELREKIYQKYYKRSHSFNKIISNNYINFALDRPSINHSFSKTKKMLFNYYLTIKNLFCELKNIRNCLRRTAPIIEKIFEVPLSKYQKFSIWECEKEDYLKILIHDDFIWNQISKSKNSYLNEIISEITEDHNINLTEMTERIEYFKLIEEYKKLNIDEMLKLSQVGSSMDTRFPEDAKPLHSLRECFCQTLISEDKDLRYSYEEADFDDFRNSEDQSNEEINNLNKVALFKTINKKITIQTKSREITQSILSRKNINKINIREDNKYIDIPNLLKNNNSSGEDNLEKIISSNKNPELKKIYEKNINNISKQKKTKKNRTKKESNDNIKSNNKKIDIPNDIDDLVKYIEKDDKNENTGKKKKKNKKKKKKKNEIKEDKKEENNEEMNVSNKKDEIDDIKEDLLKNSINRFKIHKIKFKYRPKWLQKISKNS